MSDTVNDTLAGRIGELNDLVVDQHEHIAELEARIEKLEQSYIAVTATSILAAKTKPMSPEMSATGRSDNPQQIDSQAALINSRSGLRQPNKPTIPGYGRPVR